MRCHPLPTVNMSIFASLLSLLLLAVYVLIFLSFSNGYVHEWPLLNWHRIVRCDNCTSNVNYTCPATGSFNVCPSGSLSDNIIIRCTNGCAVAGNCNDEYVLLLTMTQLQLTLSYLHSLCRLAGVPPVGVKTSAECYQDSPTAGNAQCTFNCVNVTKLDGTVFYPLVSDICRIVKQCRGTDNLTLGLRGRDKF